LLKKSSTQLVNTIFSSITNIITLKRQNHHIQEKVKREEYHTKRRGWTHKAGRGGTIKGGATEGRSYRVQELLRVVGTPGTRGMSL
jgi:hypothetical protein